MIKVLHVLSGIGYQGGVQSLIWNYYKKLNKTQVSFDFLVHCDTMNGYEKQFEKEGANIFYVPPKREGILKSYKGLCSVMRKDKYDIVHIHQDFLGYLALMAAKKNGIKVRIMHSHKANMEESITKKCIRKVLTYLCEKLATDYFACGIDAAKWTYGEKKYKSGKVYILNNAIEPQKYFFDLNIRQKVRNELEIKNSFVIGNVARFTHQKNHVLLINIFKKLIEKKENAILLLAGEGELKNEVIKQVKEYHIEDKVMFLGDRNDVNKLLQAMDVFVLTSRFEGLPVSMVEAQTADLKCVVSDNITHEININDNVFYVKQDAQLEDWVNAILSSNKMERRNVENQVKHAGFDIEIEVVKLETYYKRAMERESI